MLEEQNIQDSSKEETKNNYIRNQRMTIYSQITTVIDNLETSQRLCVEIFWNIEDCGVVFSELLLLRNKKGSEILYQQMSELSAEQILNTYII